MTVNDELFDLAVRHQVNLDAYEAGVVRRIIALLNRVQPDIVAQLQTIESDWSLSRLDALLEAVADIIGTGYAALERELVAEVQDFADYEAEYQESSLTRTIPVDVDIVSPSREQIRAAAMARPFQGRLLREWARGIDATARQRVRDAVRIGFVEGEPASRIVQRVRGTKARKYEDGILQINRRDAEAVIRTAVAHTAAVARAEVFEANDDIIKAVRWVSTLDGRTSAICRARDGQMYPVKSGPRPPAHFRCRSTVVPVTKSYRELGLDIDDLPESTRASMNGQVPGDQNYDQWLRKQPEAFQNEVLGPEKAKLFREGLTMDRFVTRAGRELTLAELRALEL